MTDAAADPARCPLCDGPNQCALALPEDERPTACWCVGKTFPADLVARAEGAAACICDRCRAAHANERP